MNLHSRYCSKCCEVREVYTDNYNVLCKQCNFTFSRLVNDDPINPKHYGGTDNPYEVIKVLESWKLDSFCLGNTIKYIARAGKKDDALQDLKKALWYLDREIKRLENG